MLFSLQKQCFKSFVLWYSPQSAVRFLNNKPPVLLCGSIFSSRYDTRFLELVRPRLAVLERRERTGVAVGGDVSLGQPCWSKISMQPLLAVFLAILMAVWPWLSFAFTSIPYCGKERDDICSAYWSIKYRLKVRQGYLYSTQKQFRKERINENSQFQKCNSVQLLKQHALLKTIIIKSISY